jgi:hypothetical protein
MVTNNAER